MYVDIIFTYIAGTTAETHAPSLKAQVRRGSKHALHSIGGPRYIYTYIPLSPSPLTSLLPFLPSPSLSLLHSPSILRLFYTIYSTYIMHVYTVYHCIYYYYIYFIFLYSIIIQSIYVPGYMYQYPLFLFKILYTYISYTKQCTYHIYKLNMLCYSVPKHIF
jgi:hypothetical protein